MKFSAFKTAAVCIAFTYLSSLLSTISATVIDGINYDLNPSTLQASVINLTGGYSGDIVIPESIKYGGKTYIVTSIGESAFYGDSELTSVNIGNSITSIGKQAFRDAKNLKSITFGTGLTTIAEWGFYGCTGLEKVEFPSIDKACRINYQYNSYSNPMLYAHHLYVDGNEVTELKIPETITDIPARAFYGCQGLTSIDFGNSVNYINNSAFQGCTGLTSLEIPNSIKSIGSSAFSGCQNLVNLIISDGDDSIYIYPFFGSPIENLYIGRDYTYLSNDAANQPFRENPYLREVVIGPGVNKIGERAFSDCKMLKEIKILAGERNLGFGGFVFKNAPIEKVYLDRNLDNAVFSEVETIREIDFGDKISSICSSLFYKCKSIESISIPGNIKEIRIFAFSACSSLKEVRLEDSDEIIELTGPCFSNTLLESLYLGRNFIYSASQFNDDLSQPFYNLNGFSKIEIGEKVTSILDRAFLKSPLNQLIIHASEAPVIGFDTFSSRLKRTFDVRIPEGSLDSYRRNWYMFDCFRTEPSAENTFTVNTPGELSHLIPAEKYTEFLAMKVIGEINGSDLALINKCSNLTNLDLSEATVVSGGDPYYINGSTKLYTKDNILGNNWSYNLGHLNYVQLPATLEGIGDNAFQGKSQLYAISIPASVTLVGSKAFYDCTALVNLRMDDSETQLTLGATVFKNAPIESVYMGRNFRCSASYYTDQPFYQIVDPDHNFTVTELSIGDSVTVIGSHAFNDCRSIKKVDIPDSVTAIEESAFSMCQSLESVKLGTGLIKIGKWAFANCDLLTAIEIPDPVEEIGVSAFMSCPSLEKVTLPGSLRKIDSEAFAYLSNEPIFECRNPIPPVVNSDTFIKNNAFARGKELKVPQGSVEAYIASAYWNKFFIKISGIDESETPIFCDNGISYRVTSEETATVEITSASMISRTSEMNIPSEVTKDDKTYRVVGIANGGFRDAPYVAVSLPASIGYVGMEAFAGCDNLRALAANAKTPPSVADNSFDGGAYSQCELSVPEATEGFYRLHNVWNKFRFEGDPIKITHIEIEPSILEAKAGCEYQIVPVIYPENATDKNLKWSSSDVAVATVDQSGLVTVLNPGTCTITASATDGSNIKAGCMLTVSTKIEETIFEEQESYTIYSVSGQLLFENTDNDYFRNLTPGLYLIRKGSDTRKIIIR